MQTIAEAAPQLGIAPTCAALAFPRASYYRALAVRSLGPLAPLTAIGLIVDVDINAHDPTVDHTFAIVDALGSDTNCTSGTASYGNDLFVKLYTATVGSHLNNNDRVREQIVLPIPDNGSSDLASWILGCCDSSWGIGSSVKVTLTYRGYREPTHHLEETR